MFWGADLDKHTLLVATPYDAISVRVSSRIESNLQNTTELDWCRSHAEDFPELQDLVRMAHQKHEHWLPLPIDHEGKFFFPADHRRKCAFSGARPYKSTAGLDH